MWPKGSQIRYEEFDLSKEKKIVFTDSLHIRFPQFSYQQTPETQFSEIFHLMNKLQPPFSYFSTFYPDSI